MRKKISEAFNGFFEEKNQNTIRIKKEFVSILQPDFGDILLKTKSSTIEVIEIESVIPSGEYNRYLLEEYSFIFFKIEKTWYGLGWLYSFYEDKKEFVDYYKKEIENSGLFKNVKFGNTKCYKESNFFPFEFKSFNDESLNKIDVKKEKFFHIFIQDILKIKKQKIDISNQVKILYKKIGQWYIEQDYPIRSELISLIEFDEKNEITNNSIDLIELNYKY